MKSTGEIIQNHKRAAPHVKDAGSEMQKAYGLINAITQGTDDMIAAEDTEFRYTFFNEAYSREFKRLWKQDISIGTSMVEAMAPWPEEQRKARELWGRALCGESFAMTMEFGPTEQEKQYYDLRYNPLRDEQGRVVGAAHFLRNVTEEVRTKNALHDSRRRLALSLDAAQAGTWGVELTTGQYFWDERTTRLLGIAPGSDPLQWSTYVHPDDRPRVEAVFTRAISGNGESCDLEFRAIRPDGSGIWLAGRGTLFRDDQHEPMMLGIVQDITDRKQAEEELRESEERFRKRTEELAAANRDLEAFSYSVSHDLRNPLHTIAGFAGILREDYSEQLDEEGRDLLYRIDDGVRKMHRLIDDMLSLSRVGRQEMHREDVDLSAFVSSCLLDLKASEPGRQTDLRIQAGVHADADPRLIQPALENLLRNAWKFTANQPFTRIGFGVVSRDNQNIYFIRDNGVGFDMQFAEKIFEPFKRGHAEKEFSGTGVGLSIVQRVIGRHDGRVWAEGEPGSGATFYFVLGGTRQKVIDAQQ